MLQSMKLEDLSTVNITARHTQETFHKHTHTPTNFHQECHKQQLSPAEFFHTQYTYFHISETHSQLFTCYNYPSI